MNKKIVIFTGLSALGSKLVGTAVIYNKIAENLQKKRHKVTCVVPVCPDIKNKKINYHVYNTKTNKKLINEAELIIFGAYPPIDDLLYAYQKNKNIISYLWSIAPIGSLEFKDFSHKKQNILHQFINASYNLSLLCSEKIYCRTEKARDIILGSLISLGRINLKTYNNDSTLRSLVQVAPFGIEQSSPKHIKNVYKKKIKGIIKNDKIILWNGGIWNWNDTETLLRAMKILLKKESNIKLIFQGYQHPQKEQALSNEAKKALRLAKKWGLKNKNVFFVPWLPFQQRANYLTESDLGISISPDIPEANYFIKTKFYDYLWANLPMIITDNEAFSEILKKHTLGKTVPSKNYKILAQKISFLLKNKKQLLQYKKNISKYKKGLTWEKSLKPLTDNIKHLPTSRQKNNQFIIKKQLAIHKEILKKCASSLRI